MSRRSERKAAHKAAKNAQKQAEKDLRTARDSARKAFDLKDPRFLGEAAVAATRGPAGLALFGASRGLQVARDKRAERAELLDSLTTDAKQHAATVREHASELVEPSAPPAKRRGVLRRFAPLWIIGLTGGAALAGATAYFLRDPQSGSSSSPARPSTSTPSPSTTGPAPMDTADPEGPADQPVAPTPAASEPSAAEDDTTGTAPAADSAAPGPAAGSAPQPEDSDEK
ncbi:MAG TPA: hypothetical protein H9759_06590 [Candidatus Dietzia intestinipullorum]|nr:hypothetical protein [Candidatus Dietzia intestinipullorum]